MRTTLEIDLYGTPMLAFDTSRGELAASDAIETSANAWMLCGAWSPQTKLDGREIERWLLCLRPQGGARSAQTARARAELERLAIRRTAPSQGDILWAARQTEFAGAVGLRSLADGKALNPDRFEDRPLTSEDLETLLDQVIEEMRRGTVDPARLGIPPLTPSGSLPKFAVHRDPVSRAWHLPTRERLSTHIIKHEDRGDMPGEAAIEAICQRALRAMGIRAAPTWTRLLGNRQVVVSQRSDRMVDKTTNTVAPIHQEEWISACGRTAADLTASRDTSGGWVDLHAFLSTRNPTPNAEQAHFWSMLTAIVLIGHRDMHRRNVGVRYARAGEPYRAELAPLYDVASVDGQGQRQWRSLGLPIGGQSEIDLVREHTWVRIAEQCRTEPDEVLGAWRQSARQLPDAINGAVTQSLAEDEWRREDHERTLARIEALKQGTAARAQRALKGIAHAQTQPPSTWQARTW